MAVVAITGTIQHANGAPAQGVSVRLMPLGRSPETAEVIGGIGILADAVEVLTDALGAFSIDAVVGFQYALDIPALGLKEKFTAPAAASVAFHLLGLVPVIRTVKDYVDPDGIAQAIVQVQTPRVVTALERFSVVRVERAPTPEGPWTAVGDIRLLADRDSYDLTDSTPSVYYRARYVHVLYATVSGGLPGAIAVAGILTTDVLESVVADVAGDITAEFTITAANTIDNTGGTDTTGQQLDVSWRRDQGENCDPVLGDAFREELVMSIAEFRDVYLFGIDLTDGDGNPYPAIMFEWYIKAATAWLEHALDIKLTAENIVGELHDHYASDYGRWGYFQLKNYPVQRIDGVTFKYPSQNDAVVVDLDWVVLEDEGSHGVVQIVPGQGNIADVLLIPGALMPMWSGAFGRVPGIWRFDYRTGFEPGDLPYDLRHLVGMMASLGIMNVAGDLVGGSGLQGWSASIPGLSQNITTTNSSTNAGFGARIIEYTKEIKQLLPVVKAFYGKTTKMVVG